MRRAGGLRKLDFGRPAGAGVARLVHRGDDLTRTETLG
jgi:hypothetical protein